MSMEVGRIDLGLDVNKKAFNQQLSGVAGGAEKSVKKAFGGLGSMIGVAIGAAAVGSFLKSSLSLGSALTEVQNVVDTTFTSMNGSVNNFATNAMEQFGLSETVAKRYIGVLGTMSKSMGTTEQTAYDMATTVAGMSGDVASFYDMSSDEAFTKLKSIWTGETESLKDLGIVMTQTALDQYAMNNGFGKTTSQMSEQTKLMLRYQYVMDGLSAANGDFAKTSDSWANQVRVLSLRFDSFKATLGQGFINLFTPLIQALNLLMTKLQGAANAFKSFTELVTGKTIETSTGAVATNALDATSNILGMGDAAESSAKKASKSLAGFDELNVLSSQTADDSGAASSAGGLSEVPTGIDTSQTDGVNDSLNDTITTLDKIKSRLKELSDLFKQGFSTGLNGANFDGLLSHISGIKDSLIDIFGDKNVLSAANNWMNTVTSSLGKITGSAASIGLTFIEFYVGSIDKYLDQNKDFIKDKIISIFDLSSDISTLVSDFIVAIADIFTVFKGDNAEQIGADIIAIFSNSFLSAMGIVLKFGRDAIEAITTPFIDNKDKIKEALDNMLGVISVVVGGIKDFLSNTFESIQKSYDEYIAPALDKFSNGFDTVFSAVLDAYNKYLAPTIKNIAEKLRELINGPVAEVVQKLTDFAGKLIDGVATIWEETLAPFVAWIIDNLVPILSDALGVVGELFVSIASTAATVVGDILDALGGLIDFIVGVFTGDWEKAWGGIKTFFSGIVQAIKDLVSPIGTFFKTNFEAAWTNIKTAFSGVKSWFETKYNDITGVFKNIPDWFKSKFTDAWTNVKNVFSTGGKIFDGIKDGIAETFKTVVNGLINGINKIIRTPFEKINSMLNTIRDVSVMGFSPFKNLWSSNPLSVPQIPALAQGGFVGANQPQLAMIGDNKREGEIVSPESKFQEMLNAAAKLSGGGGLTEEIIYRVMSKVFSEYMHIYIGEEDLARHVNRGNEMIDLRTNTVKGGRY
jgi:phage-related protein